MSYTLRRSARARTMSLTVYPDGAVVLTAPRRFGDAAIERFFSAHEDWVARQRARFADRIVLHVRRADIPRLKREALALAKERCALLARRYGVAYAKISIRAQKRRWGSCSRAGNLSFNYKIAALPPRLAEYILVHEVCHLAAFDHSARFWELVAREVPEHRRVRAELRRITTIFT